MNVILHCLLVDIAVAIAVTALYALTDEIILQQLAWQINVNLPLKSKEENCGNYYRRLAFYN